MFIIVDDTHRKLRNTLASRMHEVKLPFILTDSAHADQYMPAALVIVTERYLYKDMKYISDLNGKNPVVIWDEETDIVEFAFKCYEEIYGIRIFDSALGRLVIDGDAVFFFGNKLYLTPTEKRILLFLMYNNGWFHKDQISMFCCRRGKKDQEAVPVHICNINKKAKMLAGRNAIKYKRFEGYSI